MNEPRFERWEENVQAKVRSFPYPPTPDLTDRVRQRLTEERRAGPPPTRRVSWAVVALLALIILGSLLAVPQVRAAVVEVLRLGAVRIFLVEPTPTPTLTPTATLTPTITVAANAGSNAAVTATPIPTPTPTRTPLPTATPLYSIFDLAGETTLAQAQANVNFLIRLPTYPPDLGEPDRVFLQDLDEAALVLVWLEPDQLDRVRLSLDHLESNIMAMKMAPHIVETTTVNGQKAFWVQGEHRLILRNGSFDVVRPVGSNVLIWEAERITYRLETNLSLAEAVRVAESLQ